MNAGPTSFVSLITRSDARFVVPVYQRPYSWGEEQCVQLWKDILDTGRKMRRHFTGSVVWIQDGTMSATGVTPSLLIDGQQRVATVTLLLVALAEYARDHKDEELNFSCAGIINRGYLVDTEKKGDDRYKLILSHGDRPTLCSIVDHLVDPDVPVDESSSRLIENLDLFRERLSGLADPNLVWAGIGLLEVVSISLTQGQDNPQLIFESMNSTGKDLSSADLIRNYILMGRPMEEQEKLYLNHWRKIEETLGADSYDDVFDDFIRNYLTVLNAPTPLLKSDVYATFKDHVTHNHYDDDDRIVDLLKDIERFARYYSAITAGTESDPDLRKAFDRIGHLDASVVNPLLLSFYDDYETGTFTRETFLSLLATLESYLMRRAVCGFTTTGFNKYLPSLIARLNAVQDEGGDYREAFEAILLNETGSNHRFPKDAEFIQELETRDAYHFRRVFYLLCRLENSYHPKDLRDFASGTYTIEHILPQNALAHDEWRQALGDDCEEKFDLCVNTLGNLTLTAYNSELSDGTFEEKRKRAEGGYDNEFITISSDLHHATHWDDESIKTRGQRLAEQAAEIWPIPKLSNETRAKYVPEKGAGKQSMTVAFKDLFDAGVFRPGDELVSVSKSYPAHATITDEGTIKLANGNEYKSPSLAAIKTVALEGGSGARNGWSFWSLGEGGPLIYDLRKQYLAGEAGSVTGDLPRFRVMFWDGFYEYCSARPDFVDAFGDMSGRAENNSSWASFGKGLHGLNLSASVQPRDRRVSVSAYFWDVDAYRACLSRRDEIDASLRELDGEIGWDNAEEDKKSRTVIVRKPVDFDKDDWEGMYAWMVKGIWLLRAMAMGDQASD
jgi:uncharacterized protein with ParB-like and HNH nuclease domain